MLSYFGCYSAKTLRLINPLMSGVHKYVPQCCHGVMVITAAQLHSIKPAMVKISDSSSGFIYLFVYLVSELVS